MPWCPVFLMFCTYNQPPMQTATFTRIAPGFSCSSTLLRVVTMLGLLAISGAQAVMAASITSDDVTRLKRGEILVQTVHAEKSGGAAQVTALFHSSVSEVWDVIGYCKNEFIYVRGLELCEVLKPDLFLMRKHHRVNNNWYTPTIDFVFEASRTSPTHGEFRLIEGNLKVMQGQWDFQPLADGDSMVVTHEIRIRSRFPAPRWLVRRVLKNDLPDMLACVRGLARASGDDSRMVDDLERCPGDTAQTGK